MSKKSAQSATNQVSYQIANNLFLVRTTVPSKAPVAPTKKPVNHVAVIDCSGSMGCDLPKLREQLKMKVPKLLDEEDTLSVIWFSGRGEYGVLLEGENVASLKDLQTVGKTIDKYLRPVGLTGFKEPIEEAVRLSEKLSKKWPKDSVNSLFFMSDGCDNQWSRNDIIKAAERLAEAYSAVAFVEYGYYADRNLLASMAEKAGGPLIFAQDFDRYAPAFEAALQKRIVGAPKVEVAVGGDPVGGFAFTIDGQDIATFAIENGNARIPENVPHVWHLSSDMVGIRAASLESLSKAVASTKAPDGTIAAAYAAVSLFSVRMQPNVVYPLLKSVGDVALINQFSTCFGKQRYSAFMDVAKAAALDEKTRFTQGWDPDRVPREDAATVLDVLQILAEDEGNRILLDHEKFKYSPIGRGRVDASEVLTSDEQAQVQDLTIKIAAEKNTKKLKELTDELAALTSKKGTALKFEADDASGGYPVDDLVPNEDRPNVSVRIKKSGTVDLSSRLPDDLKVESQGYSAVPTKFRTFIYRNYTIVKDGLINVACLPVKLTEGTNEKLNRMINSGDLTSGAFTEASGVTLIALDQLPIVNRKSVKAASAKDLFLKQYGLEKSRAAQKVFKAYRDENTPKKESASFKAMYGDKAAEWLKEQGFTDYSGFAPKTVAVEATDFYMGKELAVKLDGLSKLPSMKEYREQLAKGKLNAGGLLMQEADQEVEAFMSSPAYVNAKDKNGELLKWIDGKARDAISKTRETLFEVSQVKFAVVVGQTWFTEFSSLDENTLKVKVRTAAKKEAEIGGKVEMREIQVKI